MRGRPNAERPDREDPPIPPDSARARARGGRPPASRAGDVEARILDAARGLFLARGYDGTSCDQVAVLAGAGKASIYARYANKDALFAAVVERDLERNRERAPGVDAAVAPALPLRDRLVAVGTHLAESAVQPEAIALLRLLAAEAARAPDLVARADATVRGDRVRQVAEVIAARSPAADAIARATGAAMTFVDVVVAPLELRALLGEPLATLHARAPRQAEAGVAVLSAAGVLNDWA